MCWMPSGEGPHGARAGFGAFYFYLARRAPFAFRGVPDLLPALPAAGGGLRGVPDNGMLRGVPDDGIELGIDRGVPEGFRCFSRFSWTRASNAAFSSADWQARAALAALASARALAFASSSVSLARRRASSCSCSAICTVRNQPQHTTSDPSSAHAGEVRCHSRPQSCWHWTRGSI